MRERRYGPGALTAAPVERTLDATEELPAATEAADLEPEAPAEAEHVTAGATDGAVAEVEAERAEEAEAEAEAAPTEA